MLNVKHIPSYHASQLHYLLWFLFTNILQWYMLLWLCRMSFALISWECQNFNKKKNIFYCLYLRGSQNKKDRFFLFSLFPSLFSISPYLFLFRSENE
ncbi:hypothetical protein HanRHA438_Chr15g0725751 [Helianthus annuus]|nr:hypothetical protein HanRHA438_Chr15g0725751 [Helianthus annuus]